MSVPFSAIVLAAGRSTRMGRDKALLDVEGAPLWRRQREVLKSAGATELLLSARPDQDWTRAADGFDGILHDALPDCGPIGGVTAGVERMSQGHLAVLAIDLAAMTPVWYARLLARCAPGVGAVGRAGGGFEPLAAIYPVTLKWLAWECIARGEYSLQRLLREAESQRMMAVHDLLPEERTWFKNWNAAADVGEST